MRQKLSEWFARYLLGEVIGTVTALLAAFVTHVITNNMVLIALAGTWGENLGFYGYMAVREIVYYHRRTGSNKRYVLVFWKSLRNLVLEFGGAELADSFLIRPFCMYLIPELLNHFVVGILIGKVIADAVFYALVITAYELRKRYVSD